MSTAAENDLDIVALDASDGTELYIDGTCRCPVAQKYIDAGSANTDGKSTEMASADKQARYRASDSRRVITAAAELGGRLGDPGAPVPQGQKFADRLAVAAAEVAPRKGRRVQPRHVAGRAARAAAGA